MRVFAWHRRQQPFNLHRCRRFWIFQPTFCSNAVQQTLYHSVGVRNQRFVVVERTKFFVQRPQTTNKMRRHEIAKVAGRKGGRRFVFAAGAAKKKKRFRVGVVAYPIGVGGIKGESRCGVVVRRSVASTANRHKRVVVTSLAVLVTICNPAAWPIEAKG